MVFTLKEIIVSEHDGVWDRMFRPNVKKEIVEEKAKEKQLPEASVPEIPRYRGDRAFLRPLQAPIFDTEMYPSEGVEKLDFCRTASGYMFSHRPYIKLINDTSMNISCMLEYPLEFSILGFSVSIDSRISPQDRAELIECGLFSFLFGDRPYLQIPLKLMPIMMETAVKEYREFEYEIAEIEKIVSQMKASSDLTARIQGSRRIGEIATDIIGANVSRTPGVHRFNLERTAFKIRHGEQFSARIDFNGAPKISRDARIVAAIHGLKWTPI